MEGGGIRDSQISASSVQYGLLGLERWGPELARLNNKGIINAWTPDSRDGNPWIEVNLERTMRLTGIITQGASHMGSAKFVSSFKVLHSIDGLTYTASRTNRREEFVGNVDSDGTRINAFHPPILAQFVRLVPVAWHKACTLRMELIGCYLNGNKQKRGMNGLLYGGLQEFDGGLQEFDGGLQEFEGVYARAKFHALTCNECSVGILGKCLIPDSVECDASMPNCYTGKAEFPSISGFFGFNTQGCLDSASCNSTTNGTILGATYTVTRTCCTTDNCNPVVSGAGSVQLSLTSAALVATVWGSWQY